MSELNSAGIRATLGAGALILNDYQLKIEAIEGGHRLTATKGSDVQSMDVRDGAGVPPGGNPGDLLIKTESGAAWASEGTAQDALGWMMDSGMIAPAMAADGKIYCDNDGTIFVI